MHIGVDYGSKLAGTTVVACWDGEKLSFFSSEKKKDADAWLEKLLPELSAKAVFFDAPLSLPGVFRNMEGYDDYFYRKADRALAAMSPMFLGGLTARAMRLKASLSKLGIVFTESYPGWQARRLELKAIGYKGKLGKIPAVLEKLQTEFPFPLPPTLPNWHHVDALLALLGSLRFESGEAEVFGDEAEGVVVV